MKRIEIHLKTVDDAKDFVAKVSGCQAHIDLAYGRCVVDAKSIMGVVSVAVGKKAVLLFHDDELEILEEKVSKYIA